MSSRASFLTIGAAALLAILFLAVFGDYTLDHGTVDFLKHGYIAYLSYYLLFGLTIAILLVIGAAPLLDGGRLDTWRTRIEQVPLRKWLLWCALAALVLPMVYRSTILLDQQLTDDEAVYRFGSEMLLSGRLTTESPPLKLFFDQSFMINDGRYYPQYFLGWPALMAPFVLLGSAGFANAFYFALFIVGFGKLLEQLAEPFWCRIGALLAITSPLLLYTASTGLSHSSCLAALVWSAYGVVRSQDEGASWRFSLLAAAGFAIAFFVRPQSALPVGLPVLIFWLISLRSCGRATVRKRGLAFLAGSVPLAAAFLMVNQIQNGSPFAVSYNRVLEYASSNLFRFSHFSHEPTSVHNLNFDSLGATGELWLTGLLRLNFTALGWPFAFGFLAFATRAKQALPFWASLVCAWLFYFFLTDAGVDIIGPVHYTETLLPFLVLTILGAQQATNMASRLQPEALASRLKATPLLMIVALTLVSFLFYLPPRARAHKAVAALARMPADAVTAPLANSLANGKAGLVVFVPYPYLGQCSNRTVNAATFWWPVNDPDLENPILWANHISLEDDRRLIQEHFPNRQGILMRWDPTSCALGVAALDSPIPPELAPPGPTGSLRSQPDAAEQGWL